LILREKRRGPDMDVKSCFWEGREEDQAAIVLSPATFGRAARYAYRVMTVIFRARRSGEERHGMSFSAISERKTEEMTEHRCLFGKKRKRKFQIVEGAFAKKERGEDIKLWESAF
jgi:hypothetical protein